MSSNKQTKILIVNSQSIQYFAPLYRELASVPDFIVKVLYCSRHGLTGEIDRQFGTAVQWDIPLLDGYDSTFLKNYSFKPNVNTFWGLLNLSVITHLWEFRKGVVIINGWASATCLLTIVVAKLLKCKVCLRGDSSYLVEKVRDSSQLQTRRFLLGKLLFRVVDYFLCIGFQNKKFYQYHGVSEDKLVYCPFAVDNDRFSAQYTHIKPIRYQLRHALGIEANDLVVIYSGKYTFNKRPIDLLKAIYTLNCQRLSVLFVGDGEARQEMSNYINEKSMQKVILTGFVNQSIIANYYGIADVYVMCSEIETWGLSTNEAMNFGLPILLSDTIGCAADVLREHINGYTYPCGDVDQLADKLKQFVDMDEESRKAMGLKSLEIIDQYHYRVTVNALKEVFCQTV